MKVYVYKKKNKHKRFCEFNNIVEIKTLDNEFILIQGNDRISFNKKEFMISVYGY